MLNFVNNSIDVQTLLSNATELAKFTPNSPTYNALKITAGGKIQVITKETEIDELSESLQRLSLSDEKMDTFAQEKIILIWHFSQLLPYLQYRLAQLRNMPIDTLRQYHDNSMQLQGFYQLSNNLILQLATFNQLINPIENPRKKFWTLEFNLLQQYLSSDLEQIVTSAQQFMAQIIKQRKEKLTLDTPELQIQQIGPFMIAGQITRAMPIKYKLGEVKVGAQSYDVKAYFQTYRDTWQTLSKFQFTGKLNISISDAEGALHASLLAFPSWDREPLTEMSQKELDSAKECTHNKVKTHYGTNPIGAVSFEPVTLRASFTNLCLHVTANAVLPYLITLVGIAKSNSISDVTVYAPYNYSAIMYAYGFYLAHGDVQNPTREEQKNVVEHSFAAGIETPILNTRLNRRDANNSPLLRPFCFSLHGLDTRSIYATEARVKTTFSKLLKESTVHEQDKCGILPEVLQIPLTFTGHFNSIREREMTGKLKKPAVIYAMNPVNYQALDNSEELQNYAFADTAASEKSQYKKMLLLKKKII
jgi:hypothetical protein